MVRKTTRLLLAGCIGLLVAVAVAGQILVRSPAVARWAVHWCTGRLAAVFADGRVEVGGVEGDFASGLILRQVRVTAGGRPVMTIAKVFCSFDALALGIGLIHLPVVEVVGVDLAASSLIGDIGAGSATGGGLPVLGRVDRFVIRDFTVRPRPGDDPLVTVDAEGRGGFSALPGMDTWQAWCGIDKGVLRWQDRSATVRLQRMQVRGDRGVQVVGLALAAGSSTVVIDGHTDLRRQLRLQWHSPAMIPADFGVPVRLSLAGRGSVATAPSPSLRAATSTGRPGESLWSRFALGYDGTVAGTKVEVEGTVAGLAFGQPTWEGWVAFHGLDTDGLHRLRRGLKDMVEEEALPAVWPAMVDLDGKVFFRYRRAGTIRGSLTIRGGMVAGMAVTGGGRFSWTDGRLAVRDVELALPFGRLRAGRGEFATSDDWSVEARIEQADLAAFLSADVEVPEDLAGTVTVRNRAGRCQGLLKLDAFVVSGRKFSGFTTAFTLGDDGVVLHDGVIEGDFGTVHLEGTADNQRLALEVSITGLPAGTIVPGFDGLLAFHGSVDGPYRHLRLAGSFQADRLAGRGLEGETIEGSVVMDDLRQPRTLAVVAAARRLTVAGAELEEPELALQPATDGWTLARVQFTVAGRRWISTGQARIALDAGTVRFTDFVVAAGDTTVTAIGAVNEEGMLTADIEVSGGQLLPLPLTRPQTLLRVHLAGRPPAIEAAFDAQVEGLYGQRQVVIVGHGRRDSTGIRIEGMVELANRRLATFSGRHLGTTLPRSWRDFEGSVSIDDLSLDLLPWPAARQYCGGGALEATVETDGRGGFGGEIAVSETDCRIAAIGVTITGGRGRFVMEDGGWRISEGRVQTTSGDFEIEGRIIPPCRLDLDLRAADIGYVFQSRYQGRARLDLSLGGTCGRPRISGTIMPSDAVLRQLAGDTAPAGGEVAVYEARDEAGGPQPAAKADLPVDLDCRLELPEEGLRFVAGDLTLDLAGWLQVQFENGRHRYDGRLRITGGSYTVHRRQFEIRQGELLLAGKTSFDPDLSAQAECRLPGVTIVAYAGGTIHEPDIILESDPWMTEEDIKATIIFGKPFAALTDEQRETYQAAALASLLGSSVLGRFADIAGYEALVDSFSFYTSDDADGGQGVAVDKYLTRNLLLGYSYEFGEQQGGRVRMEYKLKGGFSVESLYSEQGEDTGFDLIWRKDF